MTLSAPTLAFDQLDLLGEDLARGPSRLDAGDVMQESLEPPAGRVRSATTRVGTGLGQPSSHVLEGAIGVSAVIAVTVKPGGASATSRRGSSRQRASGKPLQQCGCGCRNGDFGGAVLATPGLVDPASQTQVAITWKP